MILCARPHIQLGLTLGGGATSRAGVKAWGRGLHCCISSFCRKRLLLRVLGLKARARYSAHKRDCDRAFWQSEIFRLCSCGAPPGVASPQSVGALVQVAAY